MGYSKSREALTRVEPFLKLLLSSEADLEFPNINATKLLYMIRDGLSVAEKMPSSPYKSLKATWKLKDLGDKILAVRKDRVLVSSPIFNLARVMKGMEVPQVKDLVGAVAYVIQHKAPEFTFPNFQPVGNPLIMMTNWCKANGYSIIQSEPFLILKQNEQVDSPKDS